MNATKCSAMTFNELPSEAPEGAWLVKDGADMVMVWLAEDGMHSRRFSTSSKGRIIEHAETVLRYSRAIPKAEGQAVMEFA